MWNFTTQMEEKKITCYMSQLCCKWLLYACINLHVQVPLVFKCNEDWFLKNNILLKMFNEQLKKQQEIKYTSKTWIELSSPLGGFWFFISIPKCLPSLCFMKILKGETITHEESGTNTALKYKLLFMECFYQTLA